MGTITDIITGEWNHIFMEMFKENYSRAAPDANHIKSCRDLFVSQIRGTEMERVYFGMSPGLLEDKDSEFLEKMKAEMMIAIKSYEASYQ